LPGERKSIEPMAARVDPRHVRARHQSMHHFIANAAWDDAAVLRVARQTVLAALDRHGPVAAWVVDDTGMPKKGRHSVGVARQYCGVLGKQDNCQVAVSVSVAHERASVPVAYRLYLPEAWARIAAVGARRAYPTPSRSVRNGRSPSSRSRSLRPRASRPRPWSPMPAMG
jgi:SRSO17 transposase